jgi:RNA polymerase sigma factor (sigma-70 family)
VATAGEAAVTIPDSTSSYGRTVDIAELVERTKAGEVDAGPSLVSLCGARLAQYARLIAPHLSDADRDEVCERAVERAVEHIDLYNVGRGSFETWLRGFVRREVYELSRRTTSIAVATDQLERLAAPNAAGRPHEPGDRSELLRELAQKVHELMVSLSETDQLLIALRNYERLPYASIAQRLGTTESACRQRHLRAIARLRNIARDHPEFALIWEGRQ